MDFECDAWKTELKGKRFELKIGTRTLVSNLEILNNDVVLTPKIESESDEPLFYQIVVGLYKDEVYVDEVTMRLAESETDSLLRIDLNPQLTIRGKVSFGANPLPCRLSSNDDESVYQVRSGNGLPPKVDSLFELNTDTALELNGFTLQKSDNDFLITAKNQEMVRLWLRKDVVKRLGVPEFSPLDREYFPAAPTGWCSWYSYYQNITFKEWARNVLWLKDNLRDYGLEWVQLDDGWQGVNTSPNTSGGRDWFSTNSKFREGMKQVADIVRENGMRPGIWLIPQKIDRDDIYFANPSYFLHYRKGDPVKHTDWAPENRAMYVLDPTNPEAIENYYKPLLEMIINEWGFDYLKIDDQPRIAALMNEYNIVFNDPTQKGLPAYRKSLTEIKKILGANRYLLGCYGTPLEGVGIMDGSRTGGDMGASWDGSQIIIEAIFRYGFLNGLGWWCDPDTICVRDPLTLDEARLLASIVTLTGQAFMASDFMYQLPKDRVDVLRRSMPTLSTYPVELYRWEVSQKKRPSVILTSIFKDFGNWNIAAVYQWSEDLEDSRGAKPQNNQSVKIIGLLDGKLLTEDEIEKVLTSKELSNEYNKKIKEQNLKPKECETFRVDLTGAKQIELIATNGGDNNLSDWSVWADLVITKTDGTKLYLSDIPNGVKISVYEVSWGICGYNQGPEGKPIQIEGRSYNKGFGAHAPSRIVIDLEDDFVSLSGVAGLDKGHNGLGSVSMHVLVDGKTVYNTYLSKLEKLRPLVDGPKEPELIKEVTFTELGLLEKPYHVFDYWENEYLGIYDKKINLSPRPFSVNILSIVEAKNRPQVISTNRHISQGAVDLLDVVFDEASLRLYGQSLVVSNDPYEIRIAVPKGFSLKSTKASDLETTIIKEDSLIRFSFTSPTTEKIMWELTFVKN